MGNRQYDVVILGATGFTGGLVADYFAANVEPGKIRWAIAGRSVDKLEAVKIRLLHQYPDCKSVGVIVCDTNQLKSVEKMTAQTKMIVTTVGPFALYGANVVKACVKTGTHYCDITGEPEFVKQMVRDYDAAAREKG
ncbi:MAG TPA: saccharopine dehydrogenase NADP-binding domain-containing protein, partial [Chitinophagales bacterium]|nr:saccharopine dehydrogenase NADP-binding domain-containing protein [Chitinophagales bacterium]